MSDNEAKHVWPVDLLGNKVKKNGLVHVSFPEKNVIARIAAVNPVSLSEGVEIEGSITLMVQIAHRGEVPMCLVLKEPDEARIEVTDKMPQLVTQ